MLNILALLLSTHLGAIEKGQVLKVEHGQARIVYKLIDEDQHTFKVLKKMNKKIKGKYIYKQMQKLVIPLKPGEYISIDKSFECFNSQKQYAYGIISSKIAREHTPFHPSQAWLVLEKDFKLEKVVNPYTIKCQFKSGEEKDYPFPPE